MDISRLPTTRIRVYKGVRCVFRSLTMNNGGFSIEHILREAQGYSSPPVLRSHVSSLKRIFPTLNPTVAEFMFNDGTQANLIKLSGTIPIFFRKNRYNIPVCIWLPKTYPASPPIAYVEALQDMFIKPGHPFVDPSGYVRVPVINTWNPQRSTLIMLCEEMSAKFSQESPIYKRAPQGANSSPRTNQHSATRPPAYEPNQNIISSR